MQYIITITLYIICNISVIFAGQQNVKLSTSQAKIPSKITKYTVEELEYNVSSAVDGYIGTRFLNAAFAFTEGKNMIALGAKGIASPYGRQLTSNQKMPMIENMHLLIAAGILRLQDKGKLKVYDKLNKYFPFKSTIWKSGVAPDWINKISIHHLLTHSSGLPDYARKIQLEIQRTDIRVEAINYAAIKPLEFKIGKNSSYSSINFILLELIIEKITGKKLAEFLQLEFLSPLKMQSSKIISPTEMLYGLENNIYPTNYEVTPNNTAKPLYSVTKSPKIAFSNILVSNNRDLLKFYRALHEGKLLSRESYQSMTLKHFQLHNESGRKKYIGYGLYISKLQEDKMMYYSSGKQLGIRSEMGYIPSDNLYFSVLSNVIEKLPKNVNLNDTKNQLDIIYFRNKVLNSLY